MPRVAALTLAACAVLAGSASAEPMGTTLDAVIAQSTDVVIATYEGPVGPGGMSSKLKVESALRGKLAGEIIAGRGTGQAFVKPGARIVAFLDKSRAWSFVGEALPGLGLDDAIAVRGFYDFNAHYVTPGLLTPAMLADKLAGKAITWRLSGPLVALSDDGSRIVTTPWTVRVEGSETGATTVTGLPATAGLPAPKLAVGGWDPTVGVTWRSGWPRPLILRGTITGRVDDTLQVKFHVEMPDLLRVKDIAKYLADDKASHAVYKLRLSWADGEKWSVVVNEQYSGLRVYDARGAQVSWDVFDVRGPHRRIGKLDLGPAKPGAMLDTRGDQRVLIQEALRGSIAVSDGARKGTLDLVDISLAPAVRAP